MGVRAGWKVVLSLRFADGVDLMITIRGKLKTAADQANTTGSRYNVNIVIIIIIIILVILPCFGRACRVHHGADPMLPGLFDSTVTSFLFV